MSAPSIHQTLLEKKSMNMDSVLYKSPETMQVNILKVRFGSGCLVVVEMMEQQADSSEMVS